MKDYPTGDIRNVAIVGHGGAGKTSLTESLLFTAGAITRQGKIEDGSTVSDFEPEEIKRQISITTCLAPCEWDNHKVNILDTPGYADFVGEVYAALRVVDAALVVVCGVNGVEVQTGRVWDIADKHGLPRVVYVSRLERENADFYQALSGIQEAFGAKCVPLTIPIGDQAGFEGVVDLIQMRALTYRDGKPTEGDVPDDYVDRAQSHREKLIEVVAETDDQLLEKYLEGEELSEGDIRRALKTAVSAGDVVPVLCGSGHRNVGSDALLSALVDLVPSPADRGAVTGTNSAGEQETRESNPDGPPAALVFKTMADPYVGKLTYFRVYSGTMKTDTSILNVNREKKERLGHILAVLGKNQHDIHEVTAGDIGVAPKLESTHAGDTLCAEGSQIVLPEIQFPEPVFSVAVSPKTKGDEEKLSMSLSRLADEDPTLVVKRNPETHETVLSGVGDMHLDVTLERLHRKFGVDAELSAPKIPYRETIRGSVEVEGKYKKQTGGRGQYGHVWLRLEPQDRGVGFEFENKIVGGVVPRQYVPAVEKGLHEAMGAGIIAGYPVVDVKIQLYDGSFHPVDSSEMAFKIAASMALKKGVMDARPALLEPIMNVEVVVPDKFMGDITGDLSRKRGKIIGMEPMGKNEVVKATAPLAELAKYATELRSMTRGQAGYSMTFSHYEEVPPDVAQRVIEASQKPEE